MSSLHDCDGNYVLLEVDLLSLLYPSETCSVSIGLVFWFVPWLPSFWGSLSLSLSLSPRVSLLPLKLIDLLILTFFFESM